MEYLTLNNSDLTVSRIGMGGCPMGGYGWGNVQEQELIDAVHVAVEEGINLFDTADTYGLGQSEITLGKALGNHRKDVVIATKFGVRVGNGKTVYDNRPEWIREALVASLRRLRTDYIDLYQVHYRDGITPLSTVVETLDNLKKMGYIRYYGLSNIHRDDMDEIRSFIGEFVSFQDEYSLACRNSESDILEISRELKMNPITWGSLGQGILTGKYNRETVFESNDRRSRDVYVNFHGKKLLKNLEIVEKLKIISDRRNRSVASCAIRFILDHLPSSVVLAGVKRPQQLLSNIEAIGWNYTEEEIQMLDQISAIAPIIEMRGGVIPQNRNNDYLQHSFARREAA